MPQLSLVELLGFGPNGWGAALLFGAQMTVLIAFVGYLVGATIGTLGAWAKIAGSLPVRVIAEVYTTVLRGLPDLLVVYIFYFGGSRAIGALATYFGHSGFISIPAFLAGSLAIGVTSGAQFTEVFRGGYKAVSRGEVEAAVAFGMPRRIRFRRIIAPLTLRFALPGLGNIWQVVLKESTLLSAIGVAELVQAAQVGAGSTGLSFEFYLLAGGLFLVITSLSGILMQLAERRLLRGVKRSA